MKKPVFALFVWALTLTVLCAPQAPCAAGEFTPAQVKKMGVFLSNFTELGFYTVDHRDFLDPLHPETAIRFGIWHNYRNNFHSRIARCTASCPYGSLRVDGKYVTESIEKYLGFTFSGHQDVNSDFITCHYDGRAYHFEGADGENNAYVRIREAHKVSEGVIRLRGEMYNPDDPSETMGTCHAEITPSVWRNKPSWNLLNLECTRSE